MPLQIHFNKGGGGGGRGVYFIYQSTVGYWQDCFGGEGEAFMRIKSVNLF